MTRPLATVLITTWQHERYIEQAIRSALAQTWSPLEIIVSDDCSDDRTFEVAERTLAGYRGPHTVILHRQEQRLGAFGNGHYWFRRFGGDMLVFNDGDDWSHPQRVERTMQARLATGVSLVTVNGIYVDETGRRALRHHHDPADRPDVSLETLARNGVNACCFGAGMAFGREVIDTFGVTPATLTAGDIALPFWAGLLGGMAFEPEPLVMYRMHAGNTSLGRQMDQASGTDAIVYEERCHYGHAAHALWMLECLESFAAGRPEHAARAAALQPLLLSSLLTHAARWTKTRQQLDIEGLKFVAGRALAASEVRPAA